MNFSELIEIIKNRIARLEQRRVGAVSDGDLQLVNDLDMEINETKETLIRVENS